MATKGQMSGMRGVFLAAAELAKQNYIVSPTSRSAAGADLLVTNHSCSTAFSVQVKTSSRKASFWLVGKNCQDIVAKSHVYVFVMISEMRKGGQVEEVFDYYVVPSRIVSQYTQKYDRPNGARYSIQKKLIEKYKDKWSLFGSPN